MHTMKTFTIAPDCSMPALGFGTWKVDADMTSSAVLSALDAGCMHIDCAPVYGNQAEVGAALYHLLDALPAMRRKLWITSKLWNDDHLPARVRPACLKTLSALRLSHLDLFLIHWPVRFREGVSWPESPADIHSFSANSLGETWAAMEQLVQEGLVRSIGVSNFGIHHLEPLVRHARILPAVNQVECHPYLPQHKLAAWCGRHRIHLAAYSPLGSPDRPDMLKSAHEQAVLSDPTVAVVAANHGATPAQVLLAWQLAHGRSAICKTVSRQHLIENLAAASLELGAADLVRLGNIVTRQRYVSPSGWFTPGSPISGQQLWGESASAVVSQQTPA
jgi:alcohol dehydrogenase (NADP+)